MKAPIFIVVLLCGISSACTSYSQSATTDSDKLAADQAAYQQQAMAFSGYNPAVPEQQAASSPPPHRGAGLRGAARGAAKGAVAGGTLPLR